MGQLWWRLGEKTHYLIIGGSIWAFGTLFLIFLVEVLKLDCNLGNAVELIVTYQLNYIVNDRLTFIKTRVGKKSLYLRRGLKFNIVRGCVSVGEWLLMFLLGHVGIYYVAANSAAILLGTAFGYLAVKRWVFIDSS